MKPAEDCKVLIVEDDPFFQRILCKRMSSEGYQVTAASDGREGMKAIVTAEPDLVISDWMMPEVDGLELCQSVKTGLREAAPYFILLTAKGEISDKLLALQTGADDYLVKPCDQGELIARVRAGLRIVALTQQLRKTVADLQVANAELTSTRNQVLRLEGNIPICSFCKKVRDGDGIWHDIDRYLTSRAQADFSHGVCPDCRRSHYPVIPPKTNR
ncbi:MAG TPA: response regulator [Candidatus Limnocylindria bacterium]|nr:response regulator [Candidatus Limnocylindria bacterium]